MKRLMPFSHAGDKFAVTGEGWTGVSERCVRERRAGVFEVVVEGLTTQAKYYKPLDL